MSAVSSTSDLARTPAALANPYESLTSEAFLKVMFAELTNQDPSKPTDSKALLEQIGTIRSIESDLELTRKLEEMNRRSEVAIAGGMLGKFAQGKTASGVTASGFIDSVSVTRDGTILNLSTGFQVAMDRLERLIDPALIGADDGNDQPGDNDDDDDAPEPEGGTGGPGDPPAGPPVGPPRNDDVTPRNEDTTGGAITP